MHFLSLATFIYICFEVVLNFDLVFRVSQKDTHVVSNFEKLFEKNQEKKVHKSDQFQTICSMSCVFICFSCLLLRGWQWLWHKVLVFLHAQRFKLQADVHRHFVKPWPPDMECMEAILLKEWTSGIVSSKANSWQSAIVQRILGIHCLQFQVLSWLCPNHISFTDLGNHSVKFSTVLSSPVELRHMEQLLIIHSLH